MAVISLPTPLRPYADKSAEVEVNGTTVGQALDHLTEKFPALRKHLFSEDGSLRSFVNVYLNDEDIRFLDKGATKVGERDALSIIPSIAGG
ncbi:MAG: ubiquitin-like small modifier protein 1 [Myxococcota bacterium]|nr:ubiquitin-like small modifier protein 1 [Myxococcota bacterium]